MSASGCVSKCVGQAASSSAIWRFSSAMMPTAARVVAPNAAATGAGAASCSERSAARISRARAAILRLRPPRLSADWIAGRPRWAALLGGRCAPQHPQGIAVGQVLEGHQCGRVVLAQRAAQRVGVAGACPDQALMGPGEHLDRLRVETVAGDRAMVVPIGADQIGQQFGIGGIGFGPRDVVAVAIAGHRQRVDREHLIARRGQGSRPTGHGRSRCRSPPDRVPRRARRSARAAAGSRSAPRAVAAMPAAYQLRPSDTHRGGLPTSHRPRRSSITSSSTRLSLNLFRA